jgi:CRISPR-associated protein Csd1
VILKAGYDWAEYKNLIEHLPIDARPIHLMICIDLEGNFVKFKPCSRPDPKDETGEKRLPYSILPMPRYPREKNGGKAWFLFDTAEFVLGIYPETGGVVPESERFGKLDTRGYHDFWKQISEANDYMVDEDIENPALRAVMTFAARYLQTEEQRAQLPFVEIKENAKGRKSTRAILENGETMALSAINMTFMVDDQPVFRYENPVYQYWKEKFNSLYFSDPEDTSRHGLCMITGRTDQPIAVTHKPEIKGVPKTPNKGGYLVALDVASPAFNSWGHKRGENTPVCEMAVAKYCLGFNDILANRGLTRRVQEVTIATWIDHNESLSVILNDTMHRSSDSTHIGDLMAALAAGDPVRADQKQPVRFHSVGFKANAVRIGVRSNLDVPLGEIAARIKAWFDDLFLGEMEVETDRISGLPYRAIASLALAVTPLRPDMDRRTAFQEVIGPTVNTIYDVAYTGSCPGALITLVVQRISAGVATVGPDIIFHCSKFALLRLALNRYNRSLPEDARKMEITPELSEVVDPPYNCGRLFSILDNLQYQAHQERVGAHIIKRYAGGASTVPSHAFPVLVTLAQHHLDKLRRRAPGLATIFEMRIGEILSKFPLNGPGGSAKFPDQMMAEESGRFWMGFYHQRTATYKEIQARKEAKEEAEALEAEKDAQEAENTPTPPQEDKPKKKNGRKKKNGDEAA